MKALWSFVRQLQEDTLGKIHLDEFVRPVTLERVWSVYEAEPMLAAHLIRVDPCYQIGTETHTEVLIPRTIGGNTPVPFVRLPRHLRAMYLDRQTTEGAQRVIAFKGTEAGADDLDERLSVLSRVYVDIETTLGVGTVQGGASRATLSAFEKLVVMEGKVPYAVTLHEALDEARAGARFQASYVETFGGMARIPAPLAVYRWPNDDVERLWDVLKPFTNDRIKTHLRGLLEDGLGVLVYDYPEIPQRVSSLPMRDSGPSFAPRKRLEELSESYGGAETIDRWLTLVAQMLALGFLPVDPLQVHLGNCLQYQNATLDGGFVDVGSLRHFDSIDGRGLLHRAMTDTLLTLARTLRFYLFGRADFPMESPWRYELMARIHKELRQRIEVLKDTIVVDFRAEEYLNAGLNTNELEDWVTAMYIQP